MDLDISIFNKQNIFEFKECYYLCDIYLGNIGEVTSIFNNIKIYEKNENNSYTYFKIDSFNYNNINISCDDISIKLYNNYNKEQLYCSLKCSINDNIIKCKTEDIKWDKYRYYK